MEFADCDPDELRVGLPLRMVYRVKDFDRLRGYRRYFLEGHPCEEKAEMASGIRDKVAIPGMGCSRFGERWDCRPKTLMLEAFNEALADAAIGPEPDRSRLAGRVPGREQRRQDRRPLAAALRLPRIAATRVENACATGTEALRGAAYTVAAGAYDIVLALGVEKLKATPATAACRAHARRRQRPVAAQHHRARRLRAAGLGPMPPNTCVEPADLKRAMAHISVKSHANAAHNPKAHLRNAITEEDVLKAATVAALLGLYDCCGVSDGAPAPSSPRRRSPRRCKPDGGVVTIKALEVLGEQRRGTGGLLPLGRRPTSPPRAKRVRVPTRPPASPTRGARCRWPRCTTASITEAVLMEDLGFSAPAA